MSKELELSEFEIFDTDTDDDTQKDLFMAFAIDNETYAIPIQFVTDIFGARPITRVPNVVDYILGIINIRGNIIPVVSIRARFGLVQKEFNERTCIIVVEVAGEPIGLVVDEVKEVVNIPESAILPPPMTNKGTQSKFISGMSRYNEEVVIMLNIQKVLYEECIPADGE